MSNYTQRQETIDALASMVIEQADRHGFKIEIDAIRDAVEQMAKFAGIEANETEFMLASQKVEDEARLMGKLSEKSGEMENPQERYRLSAMDEGNDHYSVLDTKTQLYWSSEGWQRPDSGWASVLTRSEAARKAYELNRKLSNYIEPSAMSAEAKSSLVDGEVLGQDADGGLIHWNATAGAPYNSGQTVKEFGISNLSDAELKRLKLHGNVSNYTAGQNHEPLEHEMAEYVELEVTLRSKTTFGTDKETIRVWDGQSAKDVAERTAQGYGAEVVEIRNPDGSIYEEALKVEDSHSPGM